MPEQIRHPRGLSTLFFTEMWERFSYYGMRAFLILYMVAPASAGGLGFADARAASIYGTYTGSAWAAAILGGLVADRLLGQYRTVLLGGIVIAAGHRHDVRPGAVRGRTQAPGGRHREARTETGSSNRRHCRRSTHRRGEPRIVA